MHVVLGIFGEPVLMESEPELELVLLDLHVQPLNQNHAAYGTALQPQTWIALAAAIANKAATSEQAVLDSQPIAAQADTQLARQPVFVTQQQMMHVVDGAFTEPVLMESEPEPEPVLLGLHVQPLNQNHAAYGIAQQPHTWTVLVVVKANKAVMSVAAVLDFQLLAAQADTQHVVQPVFVTLPLIMHAVLGIFGDHVLMELELELEPVLLDLHVQPLNQSRAAYGIAQQALIATVLDVHKASSLAI